MTAPDQQNQVAQAQTSDKEHNFRQLEAKYNRELQQERQARLELEKQLQQRQQHSDDDDDSEPYVDNKKLNKKLATYGEQAQKQTQSDINTAVKTALAEERKQNWIKQNPDFYDTLQHAEKLALQDPELAETILAMPEGFERQKLVFRSIKSMGLDRTKQADPTIQQKIDANRRSPFYQPSQVGNAPYAPQGDFSPQGQKQAYEKLQQLKANLRI